MSTQLDHLRPQFHFQFLRGQNQTVGEKDISDKSLRRWVFLHGLMGFGRNWQRIAAGLGENDLSFTFDQRGHGKSFQPETGYGPEDYARDIQILVDALGWEKFILVGHSMGGRNALVFTTLFPARVSKLVVEDIGPESAATAHDYYEKLFASIPSPFASKALARDFFFNVFPKLGLTGSHGSSLGAFLYTNMKERENGQTDWSFSPSGMIESVQRGRAIDHWRQIEDLKVPTLWVRGQNSTELSKATFEKILQTNARIQGIEIANAGHWVHSDQPQQFIDCLRQFTQGTTT